MPEGVSSVSVLVVVGAAILFAGWYRLGRNARRANARRRWAKGLEFSNNQLTAMRSLWQRHRTGQQTMGDALALLSSMEIADLLRKCDLSAVPPRLRLPGEDRSRQKLMQELLRSGMNDVEAQVVVGMRFGGIGPAGL